MLGFGVAVGVSDGLRVAVPVGVCEGAGVSVGCGVAAEQADSKKTNNTDAAMTFLSLMSLPYAWMV